MTPWVEKHRPKNFESIKGQSFAVQRIKDFLEEFNIGKLTNRSKKALILHGPPGVGKTTLAHVAALESNAEIFELNASDLRNKGKLHEVLKPALEQRSLVHKNKIILVDEADGISAVDRGGLPELLSLISDSKYPIIVTANDIWNKKFSSLRKVAELLELKDVDYKAVKDVLISILRKEEKFVQNEILTKIAVKSKGDLRAAINDLQTISKMPASEQENVEFDERNREVGIFQALKMIFKGKPNEEMLKVFDSVNMPLDEILLWLEKNIPEEYKNYELARAYDLLSKTDVFKGRIYKQQYWRFLVYENIFMSYGVSSSKKEVNSGFTNYKKPTRILKIWMNNQRTAKKKSIAVKYAECVHVGVKRAMSEFPIIKQVINSNPVIQKELKLSEEEVEYLRT